MLDNDFEVGFACALSQEWTIPVNALKQLR